MRIDQQAMTCECGSPEVSATLLLTLFLLGLPTVLRQILGELEHSPPMTGSDLCAARTSTQLRVYLVQELMLLMKQLIQQGKRLTQLVMQLILSLGNTMKILALLLQMRLTISSGSAQTPK